MALSGCLRCLKYIVFTLNFVVWILGMLLVAIALYMRLDKHTDHLVRATFTTQYSTENISVNANFFHILCYIVLATGTVMTCAGFLGCGGAYQESRCMLGSFSIILFLIICGEVASLTWAYVSRNKENYGLLLKNNMQMRYTSNRDDLSNSIDYVQSKFDCCGATSRKDWYSSEFTKIEANKGFAPDSCCANYNYELRMSQKSQQSVCKNDKNSINRQGCRITLVGLFKQYVEILIATQFFVAMIQLFSLMLSFGLCCAMRNTEPLRKR